MSSTVPVKRIWESKALGLRRIGRPRETWDSAVGNIFNKRGTRWKEAKELV